VSGEFQDKRVVVTAGASGIGRVTADAFLAAGARVYVCDIDAKAVQTYQSEQPAVRTMIADVAEETQVDKLFDGVAEAFGGIDFLVNNAGIAGPSANIEDCDPADWDRTLRVNLDSAYLCCRRALPMMKPNRAGCIINMSSSAGLFGFARRAPYVAAKWAIIGFTKTLALEVGAYGIRANAICPGSVEGDRMDRVIRADAAATGRSVEDLRADAVRDTALKTFVSPRDVADMILYLCSDSGRRISGQAISVDAFTYSAGE
jgi:NAD(P)-dependent dehydrogenase (short-subunit alcohol dehydrogenase family)